MATRVKSRAIYASAEVVTEAGGGFENRGSEGLFDLEVVGLPGWASGWQFCHLLGRPPYAGLWASLP